MHIATGLKRLAIGHPSRSGSILILKAINKTSKHMQDQGITITRPWSAEMYEHNARVMTQRRRAVRLAMEAALHAGDEQEVRYIARAICAVQHGQGYTVPQIVSDALITLDAMAGHWMYQDCWPALLERGIVQPTQLEFVGYRQA